jgi:MFS family permease
VVALAGLCIGLAFLLTSYDTYAWQVYFTYTLLFGIGGGVVSQASIGFLFDNVGSHASLGVAVVTAAIGVGYIIFSCLAAYYLSSDIMTWRGLFRIYAVVGFMTIFLAIGFHRLGHNSEKKLNSTFAVLNAAEDILEEERLLMEEEQEGDVSETSSVSTNSTGAGGSSRSTSFSSHGPIPGRTPTTRSRKSRRRKAGFELFFSKEGRGVQCLFISHLLSNACSNLFLKYSVLFAENFSDNTSLIMYLVPVVLGTSIITSRVILAWIFSSDYGREINPFRAIKIVHIGGFLGALLFLLITRDSTHLVYVLIIYFFVMMTTGLIFPLIPLRTIALEGKRNHLLNVSVQYFATGVGIILFGLLGGLSYDYGGFDGLWTLLIICFILSFLWDELCFYEHSMMKNGIWDYLCQKKCKKDEHYEATSLSIGGNSNHHHNDDHDDNVSVGNRSFSFSSNTSSHHRRN